MKLLSIVVPCYNEQETILIFYSKILKTFKKIRTRSQLTFEIIFVDDGSTDDTLSVIKNLAAKDKQIKYISFSRNFGKEAAIYAGLTKSGGDLVGVIDVDLQDPVELLIKMYNEINNDECDCVAAKRFSRTGEPVERSFFSRKFYSFINKISKTEIVPGARDYRLMTRPMVNAVLSLKECNRFSKGIFSWVGFNVKWVEYENVKRIAGKTSWSFWQLLIYSLDGITAFSTAPLAIASIIGFILFILSFILISIIILKTLVWGDPVGGYPSLICTVMFIGGIQLFCTGILGQYVAKTYLESKNRPIYIVKEDNIT